MLLILKHLLNGTAYMVSWHRKEVWPSVLNRRTAKMRDPVILFIGGKLKNARSPSDLLDLLGANWHLDEAFVRADQSELDLRDSTARPSSATPDLPLLPHPGPHT
jgi:hypothetical protein